MISVIVCSVDPILLSNLKANIEKTIGISYELIAVDNNIINKGICHVYNQAAQIAKYDIFCFVHEDVVFHTIDWGQELIILLSDPYIGLVGVSGTIYKSNYPSTWSACDSTFYRTNCIQHLSGSPQKLINNVNYPNSTHSQVVLIDGVFMSTRRDVWQNNFFDEIHFKGFHCYDLDFSFSVGKAYKVIVSNKIMLEHFSEGVLNDSWINDTFILHKKWKKDLPIISGIISFEQIKFNNYLALQNILSVLLKRKGYPLIVLKYYFILLVNYFPLNKFRYTKSTVLYLLDSFLNE